MRASDIRGFVEELFEFLRPLLEAGRDPRSARAFLFELGYRTPEDLRSFPRLGPIITDLEALWDDISALRDEEDPPAEDLILLADRILSVTQSAITGLLRLTEDAIADYQAAGMVVEDGAAEEMARTIFDHLVVSYLEREHPAVFSVLHLAGLVEIERVRRRTVFRVPYDKSTVRWSAMTRLFREPQAVVREAYWPAGAAEMRYRDLLARLAETAERFGLFADFEIPDADAVASFNEGDDLSEFDGFEDLRFLNFPFVPYEDAEIGAVVYPIVDRQRGIVSGRRSGFSDRAGARIRARRGDPHPGRSGRGRVSGPGPLVDPRRRVRPAPQDLLRRSGRGP